MIGKIMQMLVNSLRPLFVFGAGMRDAQKDAIALLDASGIPCVTTWGAADIFSLRPDWFGSFGTHGVRAANMAVQNADLLICIGARLDTKSTGWPPSLFAPKAKIVMVDIDQTELDKMPKIGRPVDMPVLSVARYFCPRLLHALLEYRSYNEAIGEDYTHSVSWMADLEGWKRAYPPGPGVPYEIMTDLGTYLTAKDIVVSDTGCVVAWAMQALKLPCRFIHAWNMTPMGYGLPAAIGAAFATGKRVILLTGDGGLSVNITELATLAKHALPVKILLFNNRGHAMCRQTQRVWLAGAYHGTAEQDLAMPDFSAVAEAYGIGTHRTLGSLFYTESPGFLEYVIDPDEGVSPQVKFGEPLA